MKCSRSARYSRGSTLVEILFAVLVTVILATIVIGPFSTYRKNQVLRTTAEDIQSLITDARTKTLLSESSSEFGVHNESSRLVSFKGSTFTNGASTNKTITLASSLNIRSISLQGGGANAVFDRLTGDTDEYGTFVLELTDGSASKTFTIAKTGIVSTN